MEKPIYDHNSAIATFTSIVLELLSKNLDKEVIRLILDLQIAYAVLASDNEVLKQENAMLNK